MILFFVFASTEASARRELFRPFKTDYCTGWIDGVGQYDWSLCCAEHDLYLWAGGHEDEAGLAHNRLRACVKDASNSFYASIMYYGIIIGTHSPLKLPDKKWGNAWGESDTGEKLNEREISIIENSIHATQTPLPLSKIDEFLETIKKLNTPQ